MAPGSPGSVCNQLPCKARNKPRVTEPAPLHPGAARQPPHVEKGTSFLPAVACQADVTRHGGAATAGTTLGGVCALGGVLRARSAYELALVLRGRLLAALGARVDCAHGGLVGGAWGQSRAGEGRTSAGRAWVIGRAMPNPAAMWQKAGRQLQVMTARPSPAAPRRITHRCSSAARRRPTQRSWSSSGRCTRRRSRTRCCWLSRCRIGRRRRRAWPCWSSSGSQGWRRPCSCRRARNCVQVTAVRRGAPLALNPPARAGQQAPGHARWPCCRATHATHTHTASHLPTRRSAGRLRRRPRCRCSRRQRSWPRWCTWWPGGSICTAGMHRGVGMSTGVPYSAQ